MCAASAAVDADGRSSRDPAAPSARARGGALGIVRAWLGPLAVSGVLGAVAVRMILARAGEPALPLDDAFIHLQYARSIAEGRPFEYVPGGGYTTGATSWLWPTLLAPFWRLGWRDTELVWAAWLLGALAHAGTALETSRVATGLAGRAAGLLAGAMCAFFGAFAWFAWSGMETMLLAWALMRTVRVGAEVCESPSPPWHRRVDLALCGMLGPLVRPEGVLCSIMALLAAGALGRRRPAAPPRALRERWLHRGALGLPIAGALLIPLVHLHMTGHAGSSTAQVKWLALDPTLDRATVAATVLAQLQFLLGDLLQGNAWTGIFVPDRFGTLVLLGLGAVTVAGLRPRWVSRAAASAPTVARGWRALFVWLVALGTLVPASYATMLWNRVRYIYPFAPAWFVAVACLGALAGTQAARIRPGLGVVAPALLGAVVGALASKLPWALSDLAQSARAIDGQQVELGRWAATLPADATIGVNDTGAIAYLSGRRTFDVVGLTTQGEARYWMAGAGSRYEHYERLGPAELPSHFIVYPEWLRCPPLLGTELSRRTVLDQSILGGATMIAYRTRTDLLGTGAYPFAPVVRGALLDELDVADLESEQAHGYGPLPAPSMANVVGMWPTEDGRVVADGGRAERLEDRFTVRLRPGGRAVLTMRVSPQGPMTVTMAGRETRADTVAARGTLWWGGYRPTDDPGGDRARSAYEPWVERIVTLPAAPSSPVELRVRAADGGAFTAYHYWWFEPTLDESKEP